jgi:YegS/Rv2252/BmrU family lipid kinase
MPASPYFIVNPASGGGRTAGRMDALRAAIVRAGFVADIAETAAPRHAYDLARDAIAAGRDTLVAAGGDGTVNEVASAILDASAGESVRMTTIPLGTGRDTARCLGVRSPNAAIQALADGRERRVDAGRVEALDATGEPVTRYFVVEAVAGWVGEISHAVPRWLKRTGDTAPYLITTFAKMAGPMGRDFAVEIDGESFDGRYNSISLHNVEYWGGDLLAAPGADPADGLLDVLRWGDLGRRSVLRAIQGQRQGGTHLEMAGIDRHAARTVRLSSPKRTAIDVDGEVAGYLPATFTVMPGALRFVVPAD